MSRKLASLGLVLTFSLGLADSAAADLPLDTIEDEEVRVALRQVGLQILFNDPVKAMRNANAVGWQIFHEGRKNRHRELAYSLALQAVAEASLELDREALWHWASAQILLPELRWEVLQSYAELVSLFDGSPFRDQPSAIAWLEAEGKLLRPADGVTPPAVMQRSNVQTPRRKPRSFNGQRVSVSFLVDPAGRTHAPSIRQGRENALMVFSVLQSLMGWGYRGAESAEGAGWMQVATDFSFENERRRAGELDR